MKNELLDRIKKHEGFSPKPYLDDNNILTIGFGTNISVGIDRREAHLLAEYRLNRAISQCDAILGTATIEKLSESQLEALYEMCYWLGIGTFMKFEKMIQALKDEDYDTASKEMLDSIAGRKYNTRMRELSNKVKSR